MAEMAVTMEVNAREAAKRCTMTVETKLKHGREWGWRIRLGLRLIELAAWIMWVNVEFEAR